MSSDQPPLALLELLKNALTKQGKKYADEQVQSREELQHARQQVSHCAVGHGRHFL